MASCRVPRWRRRSLKASLAPRPTSTRAVTGVRSDNTISQTRFVNGLEYGLADGDVRTVGAAAFFNLSVDGTGRPSMVRTSH